MRKINKPEFTQSEIVMSCISNMEDVEKVKLIESQIDKFEECYRLYDEFSSHNNLHLFNEGYIIDGLDSVTLKKLYKDKFSKEGQPARTYYNKIMDLSLDTMCTACGYRPADTLDHVLAKTKFPAFSITPLNLVPMCIACNKKKLSGKSDDKITNALHPYYDEIDNAQWLKATLEERIPFEINFSVAKPFEFDDELFKRTENHFDMFGLNTLYKIYVGTEISAQIYDFKDNFDEYGATTLREELNRTKRKYIRISKNSWQFALYEELSTNEWFLNEIFKNDVESILG
jgi:hypothetical protein